MVATCPLVAPVPRGADEVMHVVPCAISAQQGRFHCRAARSHGEDMARRPAVSLGAGHTPYECVARLTQHGSAAPAVSASKIGSLGQQAGPNFSRLGLHQQHLATWADHHHISRWAERLMDQSHVQNGAAAQVARDSLHMDIRQQSVLRHLAEQFGNLS